MATEIPVQSKEFAFNSSFEQQDRAKMSILDEFKSFMVHISQQLFAAIITIIYTLQLSVNKPIHPSVTSTLVDEIGCGTRTSSGEDQNSPPTASSESPKLPIKTKIDLVLSQQPLSQPPTKSKMPAATASGTSYPGGIKAYYQAKIEAAELTINERTQNLRRLEAQRNALNARGTL